VKAMRPRWREVSIKLIKVVAVELLGPGIVAFGVGGMTVPYCLTWRAWCWDEVGSVDVVGVMVCRAGRSLEQRM